MLAASQSIGKLQSRNGTTVSLREHNFVLNAPGAQEVFLVGDFNDWDAANNGTLLRGPGGYRALQLRIPNRPQHYLFVVDREFVVDPDAAGTVFYEPVGRKVSFVPGEQR
jgi:1,4-alpha-glucan branching enzyme